MLTTTIGAWPKPGDVPVRDWFGGDDEADPAGPSRAYEETARRFGERLVRLLDDATREVVRAQDELGIDIPTDGEIRRENHIHYHCRHLQGLDFDSLTEKQIRGHRSAALPTITGRIAAEPLSFLVRDWQVAQSATRKPVKMTLPGPMTIGEAVADAFYDDPRARGADLADALNVEIRRLADAGCPWIQIDEPLLAQATGAALAFGIDHLERAFHRVQREVRRVVHVCCGYPHRLDEDDDAGQAPGQAYFALAEALDQAHIDVVSIEDARRPNDLSLLERFARSTVVLGVVATARSRIEEVDEIRDRLRSALEHIDAHRLIAGPDCGLGFLGPDRARRKIGAMVEAARDL